MTKIVGLDRIVQKMTRLPQKAKDALSRVNEASADDMVALARRLVPKDTGELAQSIRKETQTRDGNGVTLIKAGGAATTTQVREGSGVSFDYAVAVEFGTKKHRLGGKFQGALHPGTPASPFFYPAYRALRKSMRSKQTRALKKAIKES